jgi:hypothetical protein
MGKKKEDLEEEKKFNNEIFNEINEEENIDEINLTQEQIYKNNQKLEELSKKIIQGNLIINQEKKQNFLIKEMVVMGNIMKNKIIIEKTNNPDNFIDPDEVLKNDENSNELFPLSLIAKDLEKNEIITAIEKKSSNLKVSQACLQILFNGMASKTNLDLKFDFGEKENNKLLYDKKYRDKFIEEIKEKISKELDITSKEILFINYRRGSFRFNFTLPRDYLEFKNFHKVKLTQFFQNQKGFVNMKESPVTKAIFLTPELLEPKFNMKESDWPRNIEYRGPIGNRYQYYPPYDWKGYGLKVIGKYENDNWLTFQNTPGEWWIAYHGLGNPKVSKNIINEGFKTGGRHEFDQNQKGFIENDLNHPGQSTRPGPYFTPIPEYAEFFSEEKGGIVVNKKNYIVAFMCRVNPDTIMVREPAPCEWICSGGEDQVRPYRILVKKNEHKGFQKAKKFRNMKFIKKTD